MSRILQLLLVLAALCLPNAHAQIAKITCTRTDGAGAIGTITTVGAAAVTALHVAEHPLCLAGLPTTSLHPEIDLAVITGGDPGECRDAAPGEALHYAGYPGDINDDPDDANLETDTGHLLKVNVRAVTDDSRYEGMSLGSSTRVRPGYSGGLVSSLIDWRPVGVISSVVPGEHLVIFTPISAVCAALASSEETS